MATKKETETTLEDIENDVNGIPVENDEDVLNIPDEFLGLQRVSKTEFVTIPANEYRSRQNAKVKAEAALLNSDETIPGGRYFVGGKWVNCDGKEIE